MSEERIVLTGEVDTGRIMADYATRFHERRCAAKNVSLQTLEREQYEVVSLSEGVVIRLSKQLCPGLHPGNDAFHESLRDVNAFGTQLGGSLT